MKTASLLLAIATLAGDGDPSVNLTVEVEQVTTSEVEDCRNGVSDLRNDTAALEYFLQDKKNHRDYCPRIQCDQPELKVYKEEPKSHLPEECEVKED